MFSASVETTVAIAAVALWLAQGWYLNTRLQHVHQKLDRTLEALDGLRRYLYEIDPQFDEERRLTEALNESLGGQAASFDGMNLMELVREKQASGGRTLNTPF